MAGFLFIASRPIDTDRFVSESISPSGRIDSDSKPRGGVFGVVVRRTPISGGGFLPAPDAGRASSSLFCSFPHRRRRRAVSSCRFSVGFSRASSRHAVSIHATATVLLQSVALGRRLIDRSSVVSRRVGREPPATAFFPLLSETRWIRWFGFRFRFRRWHGWVVATDDR